jgi:hypothetical protein
LFKNASQYFVDERVNFKGQSFGEETEKYVRRKEEWFVAWKRQGWERKFRWLLKENKKLPKEKENIVSELKQGNNDRDEVMKS